MVLIAKLDSASRPWNLRLLGAAFPTHSSVEIARIRVVPGEAVIGEVSGFAP